MNSDQINGKLRDLGGRIQQAAGRLGGNRSLQAKGMQKQLAGKTQTTFGNLKQKIRNIIR
jgi:uncharacterized protein YjbJ (UPF0337 family)